MFFCHGQKRNYLSRASLAERGATKNDDKKKGKGEENEGNIDAPTQRVGPFQLFSLCCAYMVSTDEMYVSAVSIDLCLSFCTTSDSRKSLHDPPPPACLSACPPFRAVL